MPEQIEGMLNAKEMKFAIIIGRFNQFICQSLLDGALDYLYRHECERSQITAYWVPGAFELPLAAKKAAESGKFDAVICLGAIIRGATPHFDFIGSAAASGISNVALDSGIPVIFGVITTETIEQAIERAGTKAGNKGADAAEAAVEMVDVLRKM